MSGSATASSAAPSMTRSRSSARSSAECDRSSEWQIASTAPITSVRSPARCAPRGMAERRRRRAGSTRKTRPSAMWSRCKRGSAFASSPTASSVASPTGTASSNRSRGSRSATLDSRSPMSRATGSPSPHLTSPERWRRAGADLGSRGRVRPQHHRSRHQGHAAIAINDAVLVRSALGVPTSPPRRSSMTWRWCINTRSPTSPSSGAPIVQLDEVALAMLCDSSARDVVAAEGEDPEQLVDDYVAAIAGALARRSRECDYRDARVSRQLQGPLDGERRL